MIAPVNGRTKGSKNADWEKQKIEVGDSRWTSGFQDMRRPAFVVSGYDFSYGYPIKQTTEDQTKNGNISVICIRGVDRVKNQGLI